MVVKTTQVLEINVLSLRVVIITSRLHCIYFIILMMLSIIVFQYRQNGFLGSTLIDITDSFRNDGCNPVYCRHIPSTLLSRDTRVLYCLL